MSKGRYLKGGNNPLGWNGRIRREPPEYGKPFEGEELRTWKCQNCKKVGESNLVFPWVRRINGELRFFGREYDPLCPDCGGTCKLVEGDCMKKLESERESGGGNK